MITFAQWQESVVIMLKMLLSTEKVNRMKICLVMYALLLNKLEFIEKGCGDIKLEADELNCKKKI